MTLLESITLRYNPDEDRILAVVNAGAANAKGYWLTRRMALNMIDAVIPYLERLSPVASKTPLEHRSELATMEREVAIASTQQSVSRTPDDIVANVAGEAELAREVTIAVEGEALRLIIRGRGGSDSTGVWARVLVQRIIHELEQQVAQAGWRAPVQSQPVEAVQTRRPN